MHRFIGSLAGGAGVRGPAGWHPGAALAETVFNKGNGADPTTFDPQQMAVVAEAVIAVDLFEGLMTYGADGNAVPGAAESWAVSDDGLTYSFRLRADGKWSDGTPVTAADFVFGWQRLVDPETGSPYAANLDAVMNARDIRTGARRPADLGVRAIDTRTLEVTLAAPTPYFVASLAHHATAAVSPPMSTGSGPMPSRPAISSETAPTAWPRRFRRITSS